MWMLGVVIGLIMGAATGGVGGAFAGLVLGGVAGVALTAIMNGEIAIVNTRIGHREHGGRVTPTD